MAMSESKLDITPKVIDLGHKVIQLTHVASASYATTHPLRPLGALVMTAGLGLIGSEAVLKGATAFALKSGGSAQLWAGFAAAGIGLFLLLYARRELVIRTSDGARTKVTAGNDEAAAATVLRIRAAMEAAGLQPARVEGTLPAIAIQAQEPAIIERKRGQDSLANGTGQPAFLPPAGMPPISGQTGGHAAGAAGQRPEGYLNGHGGRSSGTGPSPGSMPAGVGALAQRQATPRVGEVAGGAFGAAAAGFGHEASRQAPAHGRAREPAPVATTAPPAPPADPALQDLHRLMEHVRRADLQHKEALLDLLRVVDDYHAGRANREDALAHWHSFADYVAQYLSDVEGLLMLTDRFGRHMLGR